MMRRAIPILWNIALRNVLRHRKRTLITALVLSVGIGFFILFDSMLAGMDRITIDTAVDYDNSSVSIRTQRYQQDISSLPLEEALASPYAIMDSLSGMLPQASSFTPRTRFHVRVSNWIDETPALAVAVDSDRDSTVFRTNTRLLEGNWVQPGSVVLGSMLAKDLGLKVGDWLVLTAIRADGSLDAMELAVGGVADLPLTSLSNQSLYLDLVDAARILGEPVPITEIDIRLPSSLTLDAIVAQAEAVATKLETALPGIEAFSIGEASRDYLAMKNMKSKFSYVLIFVVLLIAAVGIVNTLLMSLYSRIREIGVLAAYGLEPGDIRRLFSIEGLLVGIAGSLGGILLGALLVGLLARYGISFDSLVGNADLGALPRGILLKGQWNPAAFVTGFLFGVAVSWLATILPARRASRIEVTEALRFV